MIYNSQDGASPLTIASKSGHTKIVRTLTGTDTDVNYLTEDGLTALGYASLNGHVSIVDALITAKADVNLCAGKRTSTALIIASASGYIGIFEALIKGNADVNLKDGDGRTALMLAAYLGSIDVVLELLTANADVNLEDNFGKTALEYAVMKQHSNVVQALIQFGANINHQIQDEGWTPLMLAAQKGNLEITRLLCSQDGIKLNTVDKRGYNAMDIAATYGHNFVCNELENIANIKGQNAPDEVTEFTKDHNRDSQHWNKTMNCHNTERKLEHQYIPQWIVAPAA
eukprot:Em0019g361a